MEVNKSNSITFSENNLGIIEISDNNKNKTIKGGK